MQTLTTQAEAIVAEYVKSYGWIIGTGNDQVNVTCATPVVPDLTYSGSGIPAIQVTATRPQLPILSSLWLKNAFNVGGSAIAVINGGPATAVRETACWRSVTPPLEIMLLMPSKCRGAGTP